MIFAANCIILFTFWNLCSVNNFWGNIFAILQWFIAFFKIWFIFYKNISNNTVSRDVLDILFIVRDKNERNSNSIHVEFGAPSNSFYRQSKPKQNNKTKYKNFREIILALQIFWVFPVRAVQETLSISVSFQSWNMSAGKSKGPNKYTYKISGTKEGELIKCFNCDFVAKTKHELRWVFYPEDFSKINILVTHFWHWIYLNFQVSRSCRSHWKLWTSENDMPPLW